MKLFEKIGHNGVYVIAEMSGNHGGSLEQALEIVRAAADAGADCLKTQTYTADTITLDCDGEDFRTGKGLWEGRTLYQLYREAYTPWEWQKRIKEECRRCGMDFLSSVFDNSSVDYLESIGTEAYKIASAELVDLPLIEYAASKHKPMIMSTGMANEAEIRLAVDACRRVGNNQIVLLKCTSEYPAVYADMNIATISDMKERFGCAVGLSDHSMGWEVAVGAVALGAKIIEKHFCLSRERETVDSAFSMEPAEFRLMVEALGNVSSAIGVVSYDVTPREKEKRKGRRSIYASADIAPGDCFTDNNVKIVRPAMGLAPSHWNDLIGRKATRSLRVGDRLNAGDLGPGEISLRKIKDDDVLRTFLWVTEPWYTDPCSFRGRAKPTWESHNNFFELVCSDSSQVYLAVDCDGIHIGNCGIRHLDTAECEIWYYIGDEAFRGRGLAKRIVDAVLHEAGRISCAKTVRASVAETNERSQRALTACGFELSETRERSGPGGSQLLFRKTLRSG